MPEFIKKVFLEFAKRNVGGTIVQLGVFGLEARGYTAPLMAFDLMMFLGELNMSQVPEEAVKLYKISKQNYRNGVLLESEGHYDEARKAFTKSIEQERKVMKMINNLGKE